MLREEIQTWFRTDGYFAAGLRLLAMTGEQPQLLARLQGYLRGTWVPDSAKQSLRGALKVYLLRTVDGGPQTVTHVQNVVNSVTATKFATSTDHEAHKTPPTEPATITALRAEAKLLHKRQADLKGRLNLMAEDSDNFTDAQRAEVAREIMEEVIPALDNIYDQIRSWKSTGQMPKPSNEQDIIQETVAKMNKLQKILPPRISKLKKYLREKKRNGKELSEKELQTYRSELLDKETELAKLKAELGLS